MLAAGNETDIRIDRKAVCRRMGYSADGEPSAHIASLIDEYIQNAHHLIEPSYSYVIRVVEQAHGSSVVIEDSIAFESQVITQLLEQCEKVAVFVLTIGNHLEEMVRHLSADGLVLEAFVLDAIGSVAAEKIADLGQDRIGELARAQGLCTSRRFSPGYCDWDISQQKMVFRAMNEELSGVRLSEQCLMVPRKSISGIIGIGPCAGKVQNYNPCKTCNKRNCPERR